MRYRNTKERIQERREFIYKYRVEVKQFFEKESWTYYISKNLTEWIDVHARSQLGYSDKNPSGQIWRALAMEYLRMKEKKLFQ